MSDIPMTRKDLERHAALLFGRNADGAPRHGWQASLAAMLIGKSGNPISRESLRLWLRADAVPDWAAMQIRALTAIMPPPGSIAAEDRDDACADALEPELTRLRDQAVSVGWHPAEVAAAILSLTIGEIRAHTDDATVMDMLDAARRWPGPRR